MKGPDTVSLAGVLTQCPALAHLDLSDNYIFGAAGAERLARVLVNCPALADLDPLWNQIGPTGADSLQGVLTQCPALTTLISAAIKLDQPGQKVLQELVRSSLWSSFVVPLHWLFSVICLADRQQERAT
jgi:hypothetical protein